ncbi:predicted protein [Chaetoceros tenuissimus]|uniref:Uncharacterized protein n=1 Tax=Chaetoceros tenuissimus TaxID=426638 RepID=A0AAD3H6W2_9STRA|nr:predicted protein [Chaetoceros tenuissimus]
MPPPPAMDDVDVKYDNIVDVHNDYDNEDGFGAFNALSSDLAAAVEIPSMPMSMPPPPAMNDIEPKSGNIVDVHNDYDNEDGFGAFNALSSDPVAAVEIPSMPMSMPPPPAMNDIEPKSGNIGDLKNVEKDDDEDGFGAFNALSSDPAAASAVEIPSMPATMLPPPAIDDVDAQSDNIVDIQNDDEDGFGAFNALSSDPAAASAVEIPSMPATMLPPPAMDDVDAQSDNIVDIQNDDEDGFGAFNALSSDPAAASAVEIPSMPATMLPPPAMDDVDAQSDNIVDIQNDDEDGFGAFNALSSDPAAASAVEIPSMPATMLPPPAMDDVDAQSDNIVDIQNDDEDGFGAFNALSSDPQQHQQ